MLCHTMLCCIIFCYTIICHALQCYALLCYLMLHHHMLCSTMLFPIFRGSIQEPHKKPPPRSQMDSCRWDGNLGLEEIDTHRDKSGAHNSYLTRSSNKTITCIINYLKCWTLVQHFHFISFTDHRTGWILGDTDWDMRGSEKKKRVNTNHSVL